MIEDLTIIRQKIPIHTILSGDFKAPEEYQHHSFARMGNTVISYFPLTLKDVFGKTIEPDTTILSTKLGSDIGSVRVRILLSTSLSHVNISLGSFYLREDSVMITTVDLPQE